MRRKHNVEGVRHGTGALGRVARVGPGQVEAVSVDIIKVDPATNARRKLRDIEELAASLRDHGLLQPLVVRRDEGESGQYILVAGHRRMAAIKFLQSNGWATDWRSVPVLIRDEPMDQATVLSLVENLQREDLTPTEESDALGRLVRERGWSTRKIASVIHRSQAYVSRRLRVYEDPALRRLVLTDRLAVSVAEELLAADAAVRADLARRAVREQWDQKRARAEARGYTAAFHPELRKHVRDIRDLVANATLSVGERDLLRQLADFLLQQVSPTTDVRERAEAKV